MGMLRQLRIVLRKPALNNPNHEAKPQHRQPVFPVLSLLFPYRPPVVCVDRQSPLFSCNFLQIDRPLTIEHNPRGVSLYVFLPLSKS
jgi:hypothetical protein